jgi:CubicO group peptidase (beta-lactamase class C family)
MASQSQLRSNCENALERFAVPAFGIAAIGPRGVESLCCLGERRQRSGTAVEEADLWHVGSCTKSMTATLFARYVEAGEFAWDAPISPALAQHGYQVHPGFAGLTLRQLLSHRAGLPTEPSEAATDACYMSAPVWEQRAAFAAAILEEGPAEPLAGAAFAYSNSGYIIAGALLEAVTGSPWEDLMRAEFFTPLGLASGGFGPPGRGSSGALGRLIGRPRITQPWGHASDGAGAFVDFDPDDEQADGPALTGPAGTVHMSLGDFARYVAFHALRGESVPGFLDGRTVAELHRPQAGEDYAFGWFSIEPDATSIGKRAFFHEGTNDAWYAGMLIVPEHRRGLAWVCNACTDQLLDPENGMTMVAIEEVYPSLVEAT